MTNAISKLHNALETWSFKYNCYEAVHPWTPFCSDSALEVGLTVFGEAIKLYTPLYLVGQLARRKYDYNSFKATSQAILRSTTFISANAFFALLFFCSSKYVTGKFYYYAVAYLPGFLASSMAVLIEKPHRRSSLAFYVANVASEALFRIYVARGYLRPINHGQVYIFTLAIATIMMLAKRNGFEDDPLSAVIKLVVGSEEAGRRRRRKGVTELIKGGQASDNRELQSKDYEPNEVSSQQSTCAHRETVQDSSLTGKFSRALDWLKFLVTARHRLCPHENCSCLYYVGKTSVRALFIGYTAQLGIRLATRAPLLIGKPHLVRGILTDFSIMKAGIFLSTFSGIFKATNCWLRWTLDTSKPVNSFIAGLVAGPALFIYPSPTIALYVLWKCLEIVFNEAVDRDIIRHKNAFIVILYGLATSQLFYSALMDPRYMKKSYMGFLDRISHHKLHMINRSVLDVFGTEASSGYEDFFPDLHPKFMSRAFIGSIWIWMIEQKIVARQLSA